LKRKVPQGINPEILLLEKMVAAPTGIEPDHIVTIEVSFEEHTSVHYKEVENPAPSASVAYPFPPRWEAEPKGSSHTGKS
jgi:hypothetical protein